jgi:hypothetical protein
MNMKLCIGLFGTCGNSTWRNEFISKYDTLGINFFNPQKDDWTPEDAQIEADHLADDSLILFPVLSETYGLGSLAETGFSVAQAMRIDDRRDFVILIDSKPDDELASDAALFKESTRNRALVKAHLRKLKLPNVYVIDTLDEMLEVSIALYKAAESTWKYRKYNP